MYTLLIQNFQKAIYPDINLSLDESLLLHRGRLGFRQYIKGKKQSMESNFMSSVLPMGMY